MTEISSKLRRAYETYRQWCVDAELGEHFEWSAGRGKLRLPDGTTAEVRDGDLIHGEMKNGTFHVRRIIKAEQIN